MKKTTKIQNQTKTKKPARKVLKTRARKEGKKVKTDKVKEEKKLERYFEAVGRRKTAVARVRIFPSKEGSFVVNGKPVDTYFSVNELCQIAKSALEKLGYLNNFKVSVLVKGGGINAQAEAIRHGTARALVLFNPSFRTHLKKEGFLTRDPRERERKKFGLKRARRAPQWQKR